MAEIYFAGAGYSADEVYRASFPSRDTLQSGDAVNIAKQTVAFLVFGAP